MNLVINEAILEQHNMTIEEYFVLYIAAKDMDIGKIQQSVIAKGFANKDLFYDNKLILSNEVKKLLEDIIIDSTDTKDISEEFYIDLAKQLKELYPRGRKAGTNYMWRGTTVEIAKKLKTLVVKYGYKLNKEEILNVTKEYVASFNGNYRYMPLLKYFILKAKTNADGNTEVISPLMSLIENKGQLEQEREDWIGTLT